MLSRTNRTVRIPQMEDKILFNYGKHYLGRCYDGFIYFDELIKAIKYYIISLLCLIQP